MWDLRHIEVNINILERGKRKTIISRSDEIGDQIGWSAIWGKVISLALYIDGETLGNHKGLGGAGGSAGTFGGL